MQSGNNSKTPNALTPLGVDIYGDKFNEYWDYARLYEYLCIY